MRFPVDVKEVMNAATDIEAARKVPVSVALLIDATAPHDLQACVRDAFTTRSASVQVTMVPYSVGSRGVPGAADMAVIAAGLDERTGRVARRIRDAGTPVLVVTTMPSIVGELATSTGFSLLDADMVAPNQFIDADALPADDDFNQEPFPLTIDRTDSLLTAMGQWVVDVFHDKRLAFALAFPFVRKPLSLDSVNSTAVQNAAIGFVAIIPGADMPMMTLNQAKMLLQIAAAYGKPLDMERLKELAAIVGGGFACRAVARQLVAAVPAWGWAVKAGIGYTGTLAMGFGTIAYFEQSVGKGIPIDQAVAIARTEAARVRAVAQSQGNPQVAFIVAAKTVVDDIAMGTWDVARKAGPAVKTAVDGICEAAGTTPKELGRAVAGTIASLPYKR